MIWLLILFCITAKVLAAQKSLISAHLLIRDNRRLAGKAVKMVASSPVMSCSRVCLRHAWCTSSNFEESSGNCELYKHEFSLINDDTKLTEKAGTTFTMVLKTHGCVASSGDVTGVTCVNGCCRNNACQNGGTCTEICEPTSVLYSCSCPGRFFGKYYEFERKKSCQAYMAAGERSSGLHTIIDDSNQSFQVFCDFASEPGFAWNLIQSFSLSNRGIFGSVIFSGYTNAISGDQPNWHAYLIHPKYLAWLGTQSTHWRATCRYDTDGVVYTDYMRTSLAVCNIITLPAAVSAKCFQFEFINIRGHECFNCTAPLWNSPVLHTDSDHLICEFNAKDGVVYSEDNFGYYLYENPLHRCSSDPNSTTQFWLGGQ